MGTSWTKAAATVDSRLAALAKKLAADLKFLQLPLARIMLDSIEHCLGETIVDFAAIALAFALDWRTRQ